MEVILKLCPNPEFQGLSLKETQALYKPGTAQLSTVLIQATATAVLSDMELLGGCRVPCPSINPGTHTGFWLGCGCCQASLEHTACRNVCSPGSSRGKHRQSTCRPAISSGLLRVLVPKAHRLLAHNHSWCGRDSSQCVSIDGSLRPLLCRRNALLHWMLPTHG